MNKVMMYCVTAILIFIFTTMAIAQPIKYSTIWINIRDDAYSQDTGTVFFGNHPNATYGMDSLSPNLMEVEAPGGLPPGLDLRWVGLQGQLRTPNALLGLDLRGIPTNPTKADTFKLRMSNPDAPSAKWTFRWPSASYLSSRCDSMFLRDTAGYLPKINMLMQDSLIINGPGDLGITYLMIYKYGVKLTDTMTEISGTIFNDKNGNGMRDSIGLPGEENGLYDWQVNLSGPENRITTTDSNGKYTFLDLLNGTYTVSEVVKSGWGQTSPTPVPPGTYSVVISQSSKYIPGRDFGNMTTRISGTIYEDRNGNTVRDNIGLPNEEQALIGWQVNLTGIINRTTVTDSSGQYIFTDLPEGVYGINEVVQNGWNQTYPTSPDTHSVIIGPSTGYIFIKNFGNQRVELIQGNKFNDINGNGIRDVGDTALSGWKIILSDTNGTWMDSSITDATGNYVFKGLHVSTYTISEIQMPEWVRTYPSYPGFYTVTIELQDSIIGKDFGNKRAEVFIGDTSGGNWSDSSNWAGGSPPDSDDVVLIPPNSTIIVDSLPNDNIGGLVLDQNSNLVFSPTAGVLIIIGSIEVTSGSSIQFPDSSEGTGLVCLGDFINTGTIDPGQSTITFAGTDTQTIVDVGLNETTYSKTMNSRSRYFISITPTSWKNKNSDEDNEVEGRNPFANPPIRNIFYKLKISGAKVNSIGNILIQNQLILEKFLEPRDRDTIIIENNNTNAIDDTGRIIRGTIKRRIAQNETGIYRFESPLSYIKFTGEGSYPAYVLMKAIANQPPADLLWEEVGGIINESDNTITVDSIIKFSRWPFGIPRPTLNRLQFSSAPTRIDPINRVYDIRSEGGDNFKAQLRLRYDQSEIPQSIEESNLMLWRGPFILDSVSEHWNMVSLPLVPDTDVKDTLFPTASSSAFAYDGTYITRTHLNFGEGYWIKFPNNQSILYKGDDREVIGIHVKQGWNLIGTISYPISISSIISNPPDIIQSLFFGYKKGYVVEDSLFPSHAYWVKVSQEGELILSKGDGSLLIKSEIIYPNFDEFNKLIIQDVSGNEQCLYFSKGEDIEISRYDLPPLPPEGVFDVRYSTGRMLEIAEKETKDFPIQISSAEYPITIRWEVKDATQSASLIVDGQIIRLNQTGAITISNPQSTIKLRLTSSLPKELPKEFALHQNYPNPFNPSTTIRYQLPVDCRVTLKIYNILGQEVKTLVDESASGGQEAGYKSVELNAGNLSSGVYFYRLTTKTEGKSFIAVKKLLLMK